MITIKFPIGKMHKPLSLYKILTYPVPLNASSTHATAILDLPSYLAVTHDHGYYIEVQNDRLQTCSRYNHLIFCNYNLALFHASVPKCSYALFKDNREEVKSSCDFRFLPHELSSSLEQLNQTHFLLYNISTLNLQCTNSSKIIEGCAFCIIKLPCDCAIMTTQYYLPQRWDGCHHTLATVDKMHPINLALLQEYFEESALQNITAESTFHSSLNITTPPFQIYNHGISEVLSNDMKSHMSLKKMIKMSKQNKLMFTSLAESMYNSASYIQESFPTELLLSITATGLSVTALILFSFLLRKYQYVAMVLAANNLIPKVEAYTTLPSFHYNFETKETMPDGPYSIITLADVSEVSNLILIKIVIMLFIIFCIKHIITSKPSTVLVLEVTDGNKCIQLPIQQLPTNIVSCHFSGSKVLTNISVSFSLLCKVKINWGDLVLTNALLKSEVPLKSVVSINPYKAYQLRQIVENKFSMFIWINHNRSSVPINVCKASCSDCIPQHVIPAGQFNGDLTSEAACFT